MNFKYELSKKDYQRIIYEKNTQTNLVYIILMSLFFLIITVNFIVDNTLIVFICYLIFIAFMVLTLFILNKTFTNLIIKLNEKNLSIKYGIYKCKLSEEKIIEEIEDLKYEIYFNDIKKIKYKRNTIYIYLKSKPMLMIFKKGLFEKEDQFDKLEQKLKEKVIIAK